MNDENEIFSKAKALFAPELQSFAALFEGLLNSSLIPTDEHISAAHRIKGGAGFLGFDNLKNMADRVETIFKKMAPISDDEKIIIQSFIVECKVSAEKINNG